MTSLKGSSHREIEGSAHRRTVLEPGAHGLVHLRAGFGPASRRWEVTAFVRNLANQDCIIGTVNVPLPVITAHPGAPRHWGTQFSLRR